MRRDSKKMREVWSKKQRSEKILSILGLICSLSIIILAALQILDIWNTAIDVFEPLLGVLMVIQTIENWKKNRKVALIYLCAAIFIFFISIFVLVTR